jgi:hypothetical protein
MLGRRATFLLLTLTLISPGIADHLAAQAPTADQANPERKEFFAGYSFLSNSFNGHSSFASHQPLNGWELSFAAPVSRRLSFKASANGYYGTSLGSPQRPIFILCGAAYSKHFGREVGFVEGLAGLGLLNKDWWGGEVPGATKSFAGSAGGGLDTPLTKRLAFRVQGGLLYAHFTINDSQIHGLPNYFARISSGLVWRF